MYNKDNSAWLELAVGEAPEGEATQTTEGEVAPDTTTEPVAEPVTTPDAEPVAPTEEPTFEVDGEKYTAAQIKEFRTGNLRQQDYTRKTQELSRAREENKDAVELFNYLREHPEIAKKLSEEAPEVKSKTDALDPLTQRLNNMEMQFNTKEIDRQLEAILSKDKMVTDMELLNIANENHMTIDKAYQYWKGENVDKIVANKMSEQSKKLTEQIKKNGLDTKTLIQPGDKPTATGNFGLSEVEVAYAEKLDMTSEEYSKYKNYKR